MSYSTSGGGTLTLPSPTHAHHVDVTSAVRSLRRSLSRSPSKFRLVPKKSPSSSPQSPLSPSPTSPPKRATTNNSLFAGFSGNPPHTPSPLAVPFPPSAKLALRSASRAKATPTRSSSRTRTSPKSPMKRALSSNPDAGNAPSSSLSPPPVAGQENVTSPIEHKTFERIAKMPFNLDSAGPMNFALSRLGSENDIHQTSSPLKRSDAIMNLDQASLGSPVAKRRSLHGSSFSQEFNVFDHGPIQPFEILEDPNSEPIYELSTSSISSDNNSSFLPRRSSSLRKSTLQQRHGEKTSWGRRYAAQVLAQQQALATIKASEELEVSTPSKERMRPRLSLDQFVAPPQRDSPFNSQGSLPNASMHMLNHVVPHQPHPLSRTMTTSSSSSSLVEESPTHVPVHFNEHPNPRPKLDFAKSLPAGTLRPFNLDLGSTDTDFSTPRNYKSAKPHPGAFASTGLISKVNRNPELSQIPRGLGKPNVPDTPCKKFSGGAFATYPANMPGSALVKARNVRHSFGTPSTPFSFHVNNPTDGTFGKPKNVFGSSFKSLSRRNSFMSMDGYESGGSPDAKDRQGDGDYPPPTPTKQIFAPQPESPSSYRSLQASQSAFGFGSSKRLPRTSSKLNFSTSPGDQQGQGDEESDDSMDMNDSPTTAHGRVLKSSGTFPSLSRSHTFRNLNEPSPTPLLLRSHTVAFASPLIKKSFAKFSHVAPASPLERIDFMEHLSPHTPQDSGIVPPDPSGLSISNPRDAQASKSGGLSMSMPPPATPTTGRESFLALGDRRQSTTPVSTFAPPDIDPALTSRFEKVEIIGTGEFSTVYKVTKNTALNMSTYFNLTSKPQGTSPLTPSTQQVYAVKKSKLPFRGPADREHKMQEVKILKALGESENVIHYLDSWDVHSYLYIQTEYCEEGSLDMFLSSVGRKGRLDDFRIWKIMLEISMGLNHIHQSGYIHLDLKPANVFITFEGTLKIGDFGMASSWPAKAGIEGEGDREYIGPEILLGKFDKPADVFSLGLIMLEIAGNVQLPDNGPTWQRLRSGDISDVSSLTWSSESALQRDATGIPLDDSDISMDTLDSGDEMQPGFGSPTLSTRKRNCGGGSTRSQSHDASNLFGSQRRGELHRGPPFMTNMYHDVSMDKLVKWMISPEPQDRPQISELLNAESLRWVASRRRAAATVYEGNWGPADELLGDDAEMLDV